MQVHPSTLTHNFDLSAWNIFIITNILKCSLLHFLNEVYIIYRFQYITLTYIKLIYYIDLCYFNINKAPSQAKAKPKIFIFFQASFQAMVSSFFIAVDFIYVLKRLYTEICQMSNSFINFNDNIIGPITIFIIYQLTPFLSHQLEM